MQTRGKFKNSKIMRFLVIILTFLCFNAFAEEPDNCLHSLGHDREICQHKRTLYYFGSKTKLVEEQLDKIDKDIRLAFKHNNFEHLSKYIREPFNLILIDYRKAVTGKDAREVVFTIQNTNDLKRSFRVIEAEDPDNYFWTTSHISKNKFIYKIVRQNMATLIKGDINVDLIIDSKFRIYIESIIFKIS